MIRSIAESAYEMSSKLKLLKRNFMTDSTAQVTIIIPTYNRSHLLKKAVMSVLKQSYRNLRLRVYDNASEDGTLEMMRHFAKNDLRVSYHRHAENIGMMKNYTFGFEKIDTPYFSFLSDDDFLESWFLETALKDFKKFPQAAFVACGVKAIELNENVLATVLGNWSREGLFNVPEGFFEMLSSSDKLPVPTCVLFNTDKAKKTPPSWNPDLQLRWDSEYLLQLTIQYPFVINKTVCGVLVLHPSSFSRMHDNQMNVSSKALEVYLRTSYIMIDNVLKNPLLPAELKEKAQTIFTVMTRHQAYHFFFNFIRKKKPLQAALAGIKIYKYFGIDLHLLRLTRKKILKNTRTTIVTLLRFIFWMIKKWAKQLFVSFRVIFRTFK